MEVVSTMNNCCEAERVYYGQCGCYANNKALICSALVALILINTLDETCVQKVAAFLNSTGDLLLTGVSPKGCCN